MAEKTLYRLNDDISFRKCSLFDDDQLTFGDCTNFHTVERNWRTYYCCNQSVLLSQKAGCGFECQSGCAADRIRWTEKILRRTFRAACHRERGFETNEGHPLLGQQSSHAGTGRSSEEARTEALGNGTTEKY